MFESNPETSRSTKVGIMVLSGLICGLGIVLYTKYAETQTASPWANWKQFTLKDDVVLGQSPNAPAEEASSSTVPPLWSSTQPASSRESRLADAGARRSPAAERSGSFGETSEPGFLPAAESSRLQPRARQQQNVSGVVQANATQAVPEQSESQDPFGGEFQSSGAMTEQRPARQRQTVMQAGGEAQGLFENTGLPSTSPQQAPERRPRLPVQQVEGFDLGGLPPVDNASLSNEIPAMESAPASSGLPPLEPAGLLPPSGLPMNVPQELPAVPPQQPGIPALPNATGGVVPAPRSTQEQPFMTLEETQPIPKAAPLRPAQPVKMQFDQPVRSAAPIQKPVAAPSVTALSKVAGDAADDDVYQVQSGDNYWTVSRRFYGSARFFSALAEYNKHRIPDPAKLKPGMYVLVPPMETLHQTYPSLTGGGPRDPSLNQPAGFFINEQGQPCYRIGEGDTLSNIAEKHLGRSTRWVQIFGMNKDQIPDGKTLRLGSVLRLPADAAQIGMAPASDEIR
ncbi:LysM peptidoglycan-binding domain-containing protein [Planctomicrobium sp. SH527]|uniref:LysM peptidoglycan-binding domain-containing protein n=1 Tax=Planctomicrobium sp. SH527 TaxID=3448123 RepID=UPI003F5B7689